MPVVYLGIGSNLGDRQKNIDDALGFLKESRVEILKISQIIEQGLGRAVRGEKDYCVVLLIGKDLVKEVRAKGSREFFSPQTRKQIEIGIEMSRYAKEDQVASENPLKTLAEIILQSL